MKSIIKIIVVILFLLLGYNIYGYCINIEGWSDSEPTGEEPYDIDVTPSSATPLSTSFTEGGTYSHTITNFTKTEGSSGLESAADEAGASAAWTSTGLTIEDDGSITGTTSSGANIDGVFTITFNRTDAAGANDQGEHTKYLKIKISSTATESGCSNGNTKIKNPCSEEEITKNNNRMRELLGTCIGSNGVNINKASIPESANLAVQNAQEAVNEAQEAYDDEWIFDGDEKEDLDNAKKALQEAMRSRELMTPKITQKSCTEAGGTWTPDPDSNTPQNTCTAVQIRKAEIAAELEKARIRSQEDPSFLGTVENLYDNTTGLGDILNNVVTTAGGNANAKAVLSKVLNIDESSLNIQTHSATCNNIFGGENVNEITITSNFNAECLNRVNDITGIDTSKIQWGVDVSNIDQSINNKNDFHCILDSIQLQGGNQTSSIDSSAIMGATQDITGGGNINSGTEFCQDLSSSQTSCEYIQDTQCCNNIMSESRQNLLNIGGECPAIKATDISQTIETNNISECRSISRQTTKSTQGSTEKNTDDASDNQTISPNVYLYSTIAVGLLIFGILIQVFMKLNSP